MNYFNKGIDCFNEFHYDSSKFYYKLAGAHFKKEKNWLFYIYSLINSGKVYEKQNDQKRAFEQFDLAEINANKLVYNDINIKEDDKVYLKYTLAYSRNQYYKIIDYGEKYLAFNKTKYNVASIYYTLGYCYYFLQEYKQSNNAYFSSLKAFQKNANNNSFLSYIYIAIATNYYCQAEYNNAIIYNRKAESILFQIDRNHQELVRTYITLSMIYFAKKEYDTAIEYLQKALNNPNNKPQLSYIYRSLGKSYEQMKKFQLAEEFYKKSLKITDSEISKKEGISTLLCYGSLLKNSKRYDALNFLKRALVCSLNENGVKNSTTATCFNSIADYYYEKCMYDVALENYQCALISLNSVFYSSNIYKNPSIGKIFSYSQYFIVLKSKADVFREYFTINHRQRDLEICLETYELLCHEMEKQRSGFMTSDDKLFITEKYYGIYCSAIQTAMQLYKITRNQEYKERALKLAEQNKSAFLLEKFNESNAKKFAGVPDQIRDKEKSIRQKIAYSEKMLYEELQKKDGNPKTKEYWQSCLFDARKENDTLMLYIKANYNDYHSLKYNPSGISSKEIQKKLSSDEAIIEYTMADSVLYIFIITKDQFEVFEQKSITSNDLTLFNLCFSFTEVGPANSKSFYNFVNTSYRLYEKLIMPLEAVLGHKNELIIIPDGRLSLIPFEALISSKNGFGVNYKDLPFLIKKYKIGYSQLLTLFINRSNNHLSQPKLLAIAPEYKISSLKGQDNIDGSNLLSSIPGITEEVKCLQKIEGTRILISDKATEGTFKKIQRRYNILHMAMHAIVDSKNPMYSKLFFSNSNEFGEDGFLSLYELMNMNIDANLVVLSACNTGMGNFQKGEGIMNLARGFFYAGCKSVIMTLWAVDDNSSSELIKGFYHYFTQGKTKTEALRFAKLDFIEHAPNIKAHPYYWAGYVNIGDSEALYPNRNNRIVMIISGTLLLLFVIFVVSKIRRRKINRKKLQLFNMYKQV